jgi:hypothetical protein
MLIKERQKDLLIGVVVTILFCSLLFVTYANINRIMLLVCMIGAAYGVLVVLTVSFRECAKRGFLWEHYIPQMIQIVILYFSEFSFLSYAYGAIFFVLIVKNIIGMKFYNDPTCT